MRLPPITSTLIDIGRPSSVVVVPAAIWSGGAQRWYSASGRCSSQSAMSTRSIGAWIVALFSVSTSTMSVRMSVVVMFTLPVLSLVDLVFRRCVGPGHHLVVGSGNDSDRCLDAWQQLGEFWKVFAVALGVRDGVGEAIAFVARHVVFAALRLTGCRPAMVPRAIST